MRWRKTHLLSTRVLTSIQIYLLGCESLQKTMYRRPWENERSIALISIWESYLVIIDFSLSHGRLHHHSSGESMKFHSYFARYSNQSYLVDPMQNYYLCLHRLRSCFWLDMWLWHAPTAAHKWAGHEEANSRHLRSAGQCWMSCHPLSPY